MLNKMYFNMSISVSDSAYNGLLRYVDSPVMFVNKIYSLHYVHTLLIRKIARFAIGQFRCSDRSKLLKYCYLIHENGTVKILSVDTADNSVLLLSFSLHFCCIHRPGKRPLSNTAVIISRSFIEPAGVQSVTKI